MSVVLHMPTLSPRALRSCITHRRHSINTGFDNAIAKETAGRKQTAFLFYIRRDTDLETLYRIGLFHAFEQQPIDPCVPLFNEKAAAVAMIRHGMHGHTA